MSERLLVIDDEPDIAAYIAQVAAEMGYEVRETADPDEFKDLYQSFKPTVIILDIVMPDVDGIELVKWLAERNCDARILLVSGYAQRYLDSTKTLGEAFGLQSITAMAKPVELPKLESFLGAA